MLLPNFLPAIFYKLRGSFLSILHAVCDCGTIASADKGTHACGPDWVAVCRVIVLDIRHQYVCVLCLADNAPDRPASPSEFFTEDKRQLARQTRKMG